MFYMQTSLTIIYFLSPFYIDQKFFPSMLFVLTFMSFPKQVYFVNTEKIKARYPDSCLSLQ